MPSYSRTKLVMLMCAVALDLLEWASGSFAPVEIVIVSLLLLCYLNHYILMHVFLI